MSSDHYLADLTRQRDRALEQLAATRAERDGFAAGAPLVCSDERHEAKVRGLEALLVAGQKATSHWEEAYAREVRAHGVTETALRAAEARIAAAQALHASADDWSWQPFGCQHDRSHDRLCSVCRDCWPCPTVAALDGNSQAAPNSSQIRSCPFDYHDMTDEERCRIPCLCQPHAAGGAYGCPEGCPTHNPGGEDVPEDAVGGPDADSLVEEPADTCQVVAVDGVPVRVRDAGFFTEGDRELFGEVIRAAKRRHAAEHPELYPDGPS